MKPKEHQHLDSLNPLKDVVFMEFDRWYLSEMEQCPGAVLGFTADSIILDNGWVTDFKQTSNTEYQIWIKTVPNARSLSIRIAAGASVQEARALKSIFQGQDRMLGDTHSLKISTFLLEHHPRGRGEGGGGHAG
jgi:hypothetical protein